MFNRKKTSAALVAACLLFSASYAGAQESRGTISGHVTDSSGGVLPDAQVRITNTQTGVSTSVRTNDSGLFSAPFLIPAFYDLIVEKAGFTRLSRPNVEVRVGDIVQLDLQLTVGDVSQTVNVSADPPLLETGNASLGQVVGTQQIRELPIASGNVAELATLAPGVSKGTAIAVNKAAFNSGTSSIVTDGNSINANEWTIDGVPNMFASGSVPRIAFSPPPMTISEFKVMTSFYDAAMGHTSGAIINMNTASGTNQLHGELHEFLGNSFLNANDYFANRSGQSKQTYQDNRYGAAVGGPVVIPKLYDGRNRTFFYYAFEGNKWGMPQSYTGTVPTQAERGGDFSSLLALGSQYQIYDPATTTTSGNGVYTRSAFPRNVIPSNRLNPVAVNLLNLYPLPNAPGTTGGFNNYVLANLSAAEDYYAHFVRFDQNFSERSRMFFRLDYDNWSELKNLYFGPGNPGAGMHNARINKGLAFDEVYTLSPTSILDFRYGLTSQFFPGQAAAPGVNLAALGFAPSFVSLFNPAQAILPDTTFSSFSELGATSGFQTNASLIHTFSGSMTSLVGGHTLHYGLDARVNRANQQPYSNTMAFLTSNSNFTNGPTSTAAASPIGQDLASFLVGIPQGSLQINSSFADQDVWFGGYLQDDWRVNSKLTVNLGLRLEHETPVTERYNRAVTGFNTTAVNPLAAQAKANYAANSMPGLPPGNFNVLGGLDFINGQNGRGLWKGQALEWMPRVALAYQLTPKTIIRAGFGIFYDTIGVYRSPAIQTGFSSTTSVVPSYDNGVTYAANLSNPFPSGVQYPAGSSAGLATSLGQSLNVYATDRKVPYSERWSFNVQREVPGGFLVDLSYVGNHGVRLPVSRAINNTPAAYLSTSGTRDQATINSLGQTFANPFYGLNSVYSKTISRANLLTPFPEFGAITQTENSGYSHYHALQAQLTKRFSHGYSVNVAYTFSKLLDGLSFLNNTDVTPWYGISTYDRPQRIAVSALWDVPFGRGRAFGSTMPRWLDAAVGNWELNNVITYQSGAALTWGNILFSGDTRNIPLSSGQRNVDRWFNTSAGFVTASSQQLASNIRTFPLRLPGVRGDSQNLWQLSVIKNFHVRERLRLQLRGESYNTLNHPNLSDPNLTVTSGAFGKVTSMDGYARQIQVAARIIF